MAGDRLSCRAPPVAASALPTPPAPRWYALPLLALGLLGFTAFWVLTALAFDIVGAWLAPLAALDMVWLLAVAGWRAGPARALLAAAATALVVALANYGIAAGQIGQAFDQRPWESALHMGPWFAWQLARLANGPLQAGLYLLALALALGLGLSGRRPAPSAR